MTRARIYCGGVLIAGFLCLVGIALPAMAADGAGVYKAKCAMCHAAGGGGNSTMGKVLHVKDLRSAEVQKQTDAELTAVIENGTKDRKMPAYKGKLTDADIKGVVAYIRELGKKK